jgi:hypothetical protein
MLIIRSGRILKVSSKESLAVDISIDGENLQMVGNESIRETVGTINLKIAQLERHLNRLEQDQALSSGYPYHKARLMQKKLKAELQLQQLLQSRTIVV